MNIPTAEDVMQEHLCPHDCLRHPKCYDATLNAMIAFAKIHVEAAKLAYFEKIKTEGLVTDAGIGYLSNAYSLKNIV